MNAECLQFLDGVLGRLGLQFACRRNIGHQRQVKIDRRAARQVVAELTDRFHERHRLDVTHRAANLADDEVVIVIAFDHEIFDLVGDMRNDLNRCAEIIAAPFLVDDVLVNATGGDVVGLGGRTPGKALIVAKVEVRLGTVVSHEHFAVLCRAHGAGIDVQIGVEFAKPHPITTGLQQSSECSSCDALTERGDHAACDEYISRHGIHRIPFTSDSASPNFMLLQIRC